MKKLTIIMLAFCLVTLSACASSDPNDTNESRSLEDLTIASESSLSQTESETDSSGDAGGGREASFQVSQVSEAQGTEPSSLPAGTQSSSNSKSDTSAEKSSKPSGPPDTGSSKPPVQQPTKPPVQEPTPTPTPTPDPTPTPTPEPTPDPTPEPIPDPTPEPAFDVSEWVAYAESYGQRVGLTYDSTATDCWDNPIIASSASLYLERDICSRLDLYAADGITYFCVWAQQRSDGKYDLYIGYA